MSDHSLERTRPLLRTAITAAGLLDAAAAVRVVPLSPEEAIGTPGRRDYPILVGRERVIEAAVGRGRGHAFTDTARDWSGPLATALDLPLTDSGSRAVYVAILNATLRHLGRIAGTVHCRDDEPELCGAEIARRLAARAVPPRVGLVGLNPAIAAHLVQVLGAPRVRITDLNPDNIGRTRFGVEIRDGGTRTDELIEAVDLVLLTGTTLVNGTFDGVWDRIAARGREGLIYGVTAAGVCALLDYPRICPCAGDGLAAR